MGIFGLAMGLDLKDAREVVLTVIMLFGALIGSLVNYFLLKATNEKKYTFYGVSKATVFGLVVGFFYAYTTKGGTGIGQWDAAWTAVVMGFGAESAVGKIFGLYSKKKAARAARKAQAKKDTKETAVESDAPEDAEKPAKSDTGKKEEPKKEKIKVEVIDALKGED